MTDSLPPIKGITDDVKSLVKEVKELYTELTKVMGVAGTALLGAKRVASSGGSLHLGQAANRPGTGADLAQFSGQSQQAAGNTMQGSLGGFGTFLKVGLGVAAGAYAAMPNAGATMLSAANYYQAALVGGTSMSRKALETATINAIGKQNVTSAGSPSIVGGILAQGIGMAPGGFNYLQASKEIGGAAAYLGMGNAQAAQAIGGMYTGTMGANLYQYGINTMTPSGKDAPLTSIFGQLYNRVFNNGIDYHTGKKVSMDLTNINIQRGAASSAALSPLGLSPDQISMFQQYARDKAQGLNPDLRLKGVTSAGLGNTNPAASAMAIAGSTTQLMQDSEQGVIDGFTQAAKVVVAANTQMERFATSLGHLSGLINGLGGSNVGQGISVASGIIGGALGGSLLRGGSKAVGEGSVLGSALKGTAVMVGGNLLGGAVKGNSAKGSTRSRLGNALSWGTTGAVLGNAIPIPGVGPVLGGLVGGALGFAFGGGGQGFGASFGAKGGGSTEALSPIPGVSTSAQYGQTDPSGLWNWKGYHTGQDYPVPVGTSVRATRDGVVSGEQLGKDYGTAIVLDHADGYQTIYGHLSSRLVSLGQVVHAGQIIGKSGQSGNVTGPHLHYEVRQGKNNPVDPSQLSGGGAPGITGGSTVLTALSGGGAPALSGSGAVNLDSGPSAVSGGTAKSTSSAGSGGGTSTKDANSWATAFLGKLGAPATPDNVKVMGNWMAWENGWKNQTGNWNNPLNTTLRLKGSSSANDHGVQQYGSQDQGISAAIATLTGNQADGRGYSNIVSDLKSGKASFGKTWGDVRNSAWVTGKTGQNSYGGGGQGYGASVPSTTTTAGSKNIYVTLKIDQANEREAVAFAKRIKILLEDEASIAMIGG